MPSCADCFHDEENHTGGVCSGSLTCMCPKYKQQVLFDFAHEVEMEKAIRKSVYKRCFFVLQKIPGSRNATEKTFPKIYKEIWYGFKIRKEGTKLTTEEWKRMPSDDVINREKRRVKHDHPELATYNKEMITHQEATYQAYLELAVES